MIQELRVLLAASIRPHHYITEREAAIHLGLDVAEMHNRAVRHAAAGALLLMEEA